MYTIYHLGVCCFYVRWHYTLHTSCVALSLVAGIHCQDHPDRQPTMCYVLGGLDKKLLAPFPLYETLLTLICVY